MTDKDNTNAQEFLATLPENLQSNEIFQGVEDVGQLAEKTLRLGGKVWDLTASKPVVPETVDGYEVTVPEGMAASEELVKAFKAAALKSGMTQAQVSKAADVYNSHISAQTKKAVEGMKAAHEKAVSDTENGLKDVWKEKYEPNMEAVMQVLHKFGTPELKEELVKDGRGNSVHFTQLLLKVHGAMSEDVFKEGDPTPPSEMRKTKGGTPLLNFPSMEKKK